MQVNNHQLKLVALLDSGFCLSAFGGYFHPPVETGGIEIGRDKIMIS
jgi:hypothetical protein